MPEPRILPSAFGEASWRAFSRENRLVAVAASDAPSAPKPIVFDVATGVPLTTVAGGAPLALTNENGSARLVGAAAGTGSLRVWSIPDGATLFDLEDNGTVDFSPEGSLIAQRESRSDPIAIVGDDAEENHSVVGTSEVSR